MTTLKATTSDGHFKLEFDPASDGWFLYYTAVDGATPPAEFWHMSADDAKAQARDDYALPFHDWSDGSDDDTTPTRDSNGSILKDGDTVTLIKDLSVKGSGGVTIKRGTTVKNISLTRNPEEIDCRTKEVKNLVLKSCFVKKL